MMRRVLKKISSFTWQPFVQRKISRTQIFNYGELKLTIPPGVFHPGYFFSTKIFAAYIQSLSFEGKKILELGCGSGLIAMLAAQKKGLVTASDINKNAADTLIKNAAQNKISLRVIHSDLFENLHGEKFDFIFINPPYFPENPSDEAAHAWYCGKNWEYFHRLFSTAGNHLETNGETLMILSEDCDHEKIISIARENGFTEKIVLRKKNWWELNTIYSIRRK